MSFDLPMVVPRQVIREARHYVESQAILFFDFFRQGAFGFVRVDEKKGHFPLISQNKKGDWSTLCKCREVSYGELCGHGLALYLRLMNWPLAMNNQSHAFDTFPLVSFFQTYLTTLGKTDLLTSTNPQLTIPEEWRNVRFIHYLGFGEGEEGRLTKRDRQAQKAAKDHLRTPAEKTMLANGFPSPRVLFEESQLYNLCKLFFFLHHRSPLDITVRLEDEHQVWLRIGHGDHDLFRWRLDIAQFIKGMKKAPDFWESPMNFRVLTKSIPLVFSIQFSAENDLAIEPMVSLSEQVQEPLANLAVSSDGNLYFHEALGYFGIQTGLSPFEMQYSENGVHRVPQAQVHDFLKQHRNTLETLDRRLMESSIFEEVVVTQFDSFELNLLDVDHHRFRFQLEAELAGTKVPHDSLRQLFGQRKRYAKIAGRLFDTSGFDAVYLSPLCLEPQDSALLAVPDLFRFMAFFRERLTIHTNQLTGPTFQKIRDFEPPALPSLAHTKLNLRGYQNTGYRWLYFLHSFGLGGLLCDQMGLGKTHQGMALLAGLLHEHPQARIMVVSPTSVVYHWHQKIRQFCPGTRLVIHHGADRNLQHVSVPGHVVLTTYGTLRNDSHEFEQRPYDLILFDEIQNLKNKATKAYRQIAKMRAHCRIGLTGTPIENDLSDLKSLMDLVMPGFLGSDASFDSYFLKPIQKFNDRRSKERLKHTVHPFMLRRSKAEVLTELPAKTEDLRSLVLGAYERELYEEVKLNGKQGVAEEEKTKGKPSFLHIFNLIDSLKRICNHPALYFGNTDYAAYPSAKWELFTDLLGETLASGQKIVVFTQYLGMIDLFQAYLREKRIGFACITGATRERANEQGRFQDDPECRVFLGTILAAGVGIDLTAGSVLIHYDRWWNPAKEEQATDRIHRIGQEQAVQIYKFKGIKTVEERINQIIERKRALLEETVGFDNEAAAKVFSMQELLDILA